MIRRPISPSWSGAVAGATVSGMVAALFVIVGAAAGGGNPGDVLTEAARRGDRTGVERLLDAEALTPAELERALAAAREAGRVEVSRLLGARLADLAGPAPPNPPGSPGTTGRAP